MTASPIERRVAFGGVPIAWRCAADLADPVAPLLGALEASDREPRLRIDVLPLERSVDAPRGTFFFDEVIGAHDASGTHLFTPFGRVDVSPEGRAISIFVPRARPIPEPFVSRAVLVGLVLALLHHGLHHVHAAALLDGQDAIWIAGPSGSGKSTTTIALAEAGLDPATDDALFVRADASGPRDAHAAPLPFHVGDRTRAAFASIAAATHDAPRLESGKRAVDPASVWPGRVRRTTPLPKRLLFPEIAATGATRASPLSAADALGRLIAASAWLVLPGVPSVPRHLDVLRTIVDGAAAYTLTLGRDALDDPSLVARWVRGL